MKYLLLLFILTLPIFGQGVDTLFYKGSTENYSHDSLIKYEFTVQDSSTTIKLFFREILFRDPLPTYIYVLGETLALNKGDTLVGDAFHVSWDLVYRYKIYSIGRSNNIIIIGWLTDIGWFPIISRISRGSIETTNQYNLKGQIFGREPKRYIKVFR